LLWLVVVLVVNVVSKGCHDAARVVGGGRVRVPIGRPRRRRLNRGGAVAEVFAASRASFVPVAVAAPDALDLLDEEVDGFSRAVACPFGFEVGLSGIYGTGPVIGACQNLVRGTDLPLP
jgi:hypothetical protein